MKSVFITAIDTLAGKTVVASGIVKGTDALYWKPLGTGEDDTTEAKRLSDLPEEKFLPPAYRFQAPLSAHLASRREGVDIDPAKILRCFQDYRSRGNLCVEGAGGLLVPLRRGLLLADVVKALELPVIIVTVDRLGAINHTLLTLQACRQRGIPVEGVIWNRANGNYGNRESVEEFGEVSTLLELQKEKDPRSAVNRVATWAAGYFA